ncbi:MAG: monovalent cation/proton antiporter, MnhG/PhaG subunit [Clostridiales bacterium]|jgi:multicomponent Na+:H+ antiporter subunit G|nr:monovalent cation/proton antiporter, MnhG/PhaG subunit [Clostridiales bacterium]
MAIVAIIFLLGGFFFTFVAALGVIRLPDFYSRLHASGKCETLGMVLSFLGLAIYEGFTLTALKLFFIVIFIFIANPTGTHILSRAAYRSGIKPWTRKGE